MTARLPVWAKVLLGLALAALIVAVVLLVPVISRDKKQYRESQRREAAAARVAQIRALRAEQRPRRGTLSAPSAAQLEARITRDARSRVREPVKRTECRRLRGGGALAFACTAVIADIPGSATGILGYPYRALIDPHTARYAICKTAGRPGEGSLTGKNPVALPRACGG